MRCWATSRSSAAWWRGRCPRSSRRSCSSRGPPRRARAPRPRPPMPASKGMPQAPGAPAGVESPERAPARAARRCLTAARLRWAAHTRRASCPRARPRAAGRRCRARPAADRCPRPTASRCRRSWPCRLGGPPRRPAARPRRHAGTAPWRRVGTELKTCVLGCSRGLRPADCKRCWLTRHAGGPAGAQQPACRLKATPPPV